MAATVGIDSEFPYVKIVSCYFQCVRFLSCSCIYTSICTVSLVFSYLIFSRCSFLLVRYQLNQWLAFLRAQNARRLSRFDSASSVSSLLLTLLLLKKADIEANLCLLNNYIFCIKLYEIYVELLANSLEIDLKWLLWCVTSDRFLRMHTNLHWALSFLMTLKGNLC